MAGNFFDKYDDSQQSVDNTTNYFDKYDPPPKRTLGSTAKDVGVSIAKGTVAAGQGVLGVADILTMGDVGQKLDSIGVRPDEWQKSLDSKYSPAQQAANKKVDEAEGFLGTAGAMIENPSTIAHGIIETVPSVAAGGALGRGALAVGSKLAPKVIGGASNAVKGIGAGALGEGTIAAGQTAEEIRTNTEDRDLTGKQAGLAALSGLGTAVFGVAGGALARKLGFADIDSLAVGLSGGNKKGFKDIVKSVVGGGISEGVLEELPQTVQETILQNAALDKPLLEGVPEGAAQAIILGGAMGAGANMLPGRSSTPLPEPRQETLGIVQPPPDQGDVFPVEQTPQATGGFKPGPITSQPPAVPNIDMVTGQIVQPTATEAPTPTGPISKALGTVPVPPAPPAAHGQEVQPPPTGPLDQPIRSGLARPTPVTGTEAGVQEEGPAIQGQQQQSRENIIIRNPARSWIVMEHGPDVVRELSEAKNAGTPISIAQAKENIKARAEDNEGYARDQMYDFIDQAEAGQANEDTKFRKAKFDKLRSENESTKTPTQGTEEPWVDSIQSIRDISGEQVPGSDTSDRETERGSAGDSSVESVRSETSNDNEQSGDFRPSMDEGRGGNPNQRDSSAPSGLESLPPGSERRETPDEAPRGGEPAEYPSWSEGINGKRNIDERPAYVESDDRRLSDNPREDQGGRWQNNGQEAANFEARAEEARNDNLPGKQVVSGGSIVEVNSPAQTQPSTSLADENPIVKDGVAGQQTTNKFTQNNITDSNKKYNKITATSPTPDASTDQQLTSASASSQSGVTSQVVAEDNVDNKSNNVDKPSTSLADETPIVKDGVAGQQTTNKLPNKSPYTPEQLDSVEVEISTDLLETSDGKPIKMKASQALKMLDDDISIYKKLMDCVK